MGLLVLNVVNIAIGYTSSNNYITFRFALYSLFLQSELCFVVSLQPHRRIRDFNLNLLTLPTMSNFCHYRRVIWILTGLRMIMELQALW